MKRDEHVTVAVGSLLVHRPEATVRSWVQAGRVAGRKRRGRWLINRRGLVSYARRMDEQDQDEEDKNYEFQPISQPEHGLGYMQRRGAS
jgi:hypothetical protein